MKRLAAFPILRKYHVSCLTTTFGYGRMLQSFKPMNQRVTEFQCIMPLENIPSVLKRGILSNERAAKVPHYSVAMEVVQERRESRQIPRGLKLHQYANLYFHARNPMLFKKKRKRQICASCASQLK